MRKLNSKRIAISIFLIIMIIVEIIAFGLSRAQNVKEIKATIEDNSGILAKEEGTLQAIDEGESRILHNFARCNK